MTSNFDKYPSIKVSENNGDCITGWRNIAEKINDAVEAKGNSKIVVVIDCYQGIHHHEVETALRSELRYDHFVRSTTAFKCEEEIAAMVYPDVTDDQIFGFMTALTMSKFFNDQKLSAFQKEIHGIAAGVIVVYGEGAAHVVPQGDIMVYLDMARWEIQARMRRGKVNNLGVKNAGAGFSQQYKQAYFVDWRVLDKHKMSFYDNIDFSIDTTKPGLPKMVAASLVRKGLEVASHRPFRVVPFFDPGPWGGQWLKEVADLDRSAVNYAWGFDCVPEENSLLLKFGNATFEIPSINLVLKHPVELLGEKVYNKFGAEFPIRFDFLDTMDGGNLSLQVHPTTQYIKDSFGMEYTQDESYYLVDVKEGAHVYLGLKDEVVPETMIEELKKSQTPGMQFDAEKHVQKWEVNKHDHILIPAGTVHCSGRDTVVLEISATPYIFTFKLWDWGRLGLDGKPRPINITHGEKVIQWDRRVAWTKENLINRFENIAEGDGWTEERTGLHEFQFIETRRHWFTGTVPHHTQGGVNVLNLVEGREVIVESPDHSFEPFIVHYAETFIVPAAVGAYTIRPYGEAVGTKCATLKAFVRTEAIKNGNYLSAKEASTIQT